MRLLPPPRLCGGRQRDVEGESRVDLPSDFLTYPDDISRPPVISPRIRVRELCKSAAQHPHLRHRQPHRLARMQAVRKVGVLEHPFYVYCISLAFEMRIDDTCGVLIRQCEKEIHLMRLERIRSLLAQAIDGSRVPVIPLGVAQLAHLDEDTRDDSCAGTDYEDQQP